MDSWISVVDGAQGCFCWMDCEGHKRLAVPIASDKFEWLKQVVMDMAELFGEPLADTLLAWIDLSDLGSEVCSSARLIAPLAPERARRDCELWMHAMRERSELAARISALDKRAGQLRL